MKHASECQFNFDGIAQMDRAFSYELKGQRFESFFHRHLIIEFKNMTKLKQLIEKSNFIINGPNRHQFNPINPAFSSHPLNNNTYIEIFEEINNRLNHLDIVSDRIIDNLLTISDILKKIRDK